MPETRTYSPEEIRKWKALIYGGDVGIKVDEWVSSDQSQSTSSRRNALRKNGSSKRTNTSGKNNLPSSSADEWLSSPSTKKGSYRVKGTTKRQW